MRPAIVSSLRFALFGLALLATAKTCEGAPNSVSQALVFIANDGEAPLDLATSHRNIDGVVTDVVMPRPGGCEPISRLRIDRPEMPVLFVPGHSNHGESLLHGTSGRAAVLNQPFTAAQLQEALDPLLPGAEPLVVG